MKRLAGTVITLRIPIIIVTVAITAGLRWIEGREGTTFRLSKEESEIYLQGNFSF